MTDSNIFKLNKPDQSDPLHEVLREGARKMLAVVKNGYLPVRSIQTGFGDIEVKVSKVRERCESVIKFNNSLVPPYLKRVKNIEEFFPWLYLREISQRR